MAENQKDYSRLEQRYVSIFIAKYRQHVKFIDYLMCKEKNVLLKNIFKLA